MDFTPDYSVAAKMRLPPGGQAHLKQQDNRAVIAWRGAAITRLVSSADRAYMKGSSLILLP